MQFSRCLRRLGMALSMKNNTLMIDLIRAACDEAVHRNELPGGVVTVGRSDELLLEHAFGNRSRNPHTEPATIDTIYDLASLTKPLVTATLVMQAVEEGKLNLFEPLSRYLDIPPDDPVGQLIPRDLLLHISGLPAGYDNASMVRSVEDLVEKIVENGLATPTGESFTYSDAGFVLLGRLTELIHGAPMADLARSRILEPLEMRNTNYGVKKNDIPRCAPTELCNGTPLRGVVHDPMTREIGGIAGHAGLFGTARDLSRYCRMILHRGFLDGNRVLMPATVDRMVSPVPVPGGKLRSLGWDVDTQYSSPRGEILPVRGIGHTGFTGTSVWIDPKTGLYFILLTNRVHPDGSGDAVRLRRSVANIAAAHLLP